MGASPVALPSAAQGHTHSVQFYEDDSVLLDGLSRYVGSALGAGGAAIVVATKPHREGLVQRLSWSIDLQSVATNRRYIAVDAVDTLSRFIVDDWPDESRFHAVLSGLLLEASIGGSSERSSPVVFGEMVALLWAEGKIEAAVRLEQLWNQLAVTHSFQLRCAYPMWGFGQASHDASFKLICAEHSHVIPAESYMSLEKEEERLRQVSLLQQKAQALQEIGDERERLYKDAQVEIARRIAAESALRESEEFARGILENSVDCLQVMEVDGTVLYTSPAGQKAMAIEGDDFPAKIQWKDGW
ncbi:MAG: MEDS domain-containing protein, partial [Acidobacteriaceae bacterium]